MQSGRYSPEPDFSTCRGRTRISRAGNVSKPQQAPTCSELTGAQGSRSQRPSPGRHLPSEAVRPAPRPGRRNPAKPLCSGNHGFTLSGLRSGPPRPRWSRGEEAEKGENKHEKTRSGRGSPEGAEHRKRENGEGGPFLEGSQPDTRAPYPVPHPPRPSPA